jgi:hypothetical protein
MAVMTRHFICHGVLLHLADKDSKIFDGLTVYKLLLTLKGYNVWARNQKPLFTELLGLPAALDNAPPPRGNPKATTNNPAPKFSRFA